MISLEKTSENNERKLLSLFEGNRDCYFSLGRLSIETGMPQEDIQEYIKQHSNLIRKSILKTRREENYYILNSKFGFLKDSFNFLCYLCEQQYKLKGID